MSIVFDISSYNPLHASSAIIPDAGGFVKEASHLGNGDRGLEYVSLGVQPSKPVSNVHVSALTADTNKIIVRRLINRIIFVFFILTH
jgi:hypothetical protein